MLMCFVKRSSVINLIYSGQELLDSSHKVFINVVSSKAGGTQPVFKHESRPRILWSNED